MAAQRFPSWSFSVVGGTLGAKLKEASKRNTDAAGHSLFRSEPGRAYQAIDTTREMGAGPTPYPLKAYPKDQ